MKTDYNLYGLLEDRSVTIPMIQRDYAQGRQGKEAIRINFLKQIYRGLAENKGLKLDFVYGRDDGAKFQPLDGQQRLTTMWLVHWYLLFRAGDPIFITLEKLKKVLNEDNANSSSEKLLKRLNETENRIIIDYYTKNTEDSYSISDIVGGFDEFDNLTLDAKKLFEQKASDYWHILLKFTYETRTSSKDFCESLCTEMCHISYDETKKYRTVADYIINQNWFYSQWLYDPTVNSMLRAIGGSPNESEDRKKDLKNIVHSLEQFESFKNWLSDKPINENSFNGYSTLNDFINNDTYINEWADAELIGEVKTLCAVLLSQPSTEASFDFFIGNAESCVSNEGEKNTIRRFCRLIEKKNKSIIEKSDSKTLASKSSIFDYIVSQPGFKSTWLDIFKISKTLRQLSSDCIDGVFNEVGNIDFRMFLNRLIDKNKTSFSVPNIAKEQLPEESYDDLYVKMNARGKKLTSFENWKADFFSLVREYKDTNYDSDSIINGVDSYWTDVAFEYLKKHVNNDPDKIESNVCIVDDVLFMIVNRFALNKVILNMLIKDMPASKVKYDDVFRKLYGRIDDDEKSADALIEYENIDPYKEILEAQACKDLDLLFKFLSKYSSKDVLELHSYRKDTCWEFMPRLIETVNPQPNTKTLSTGNTTLEERVYFHSTTMFVLSLYEAKWLDENGDPTEFFSKVSYNSVLSDWRRVTKNLIENADISTVADMCNCMERIDELGRELPKYNMDVYQILSGKDGFETNQKGNTIFRSQLDLQYQEEIFKAQEIKNAVPTVTKSDIASEEDHGFFHGTIRFLFEPDANKGVVDWSNFITKKGNANSYFPKDSDQVEWKVANEFLKYLIEIKNVRITKKGTSKKHNEACWIKSILCNPELSEEVDAFLQRDTSKTGSCANISDIIALFNVMTKTPDSDNKEICLEKGINCPYFHFRNGKNYYYYIGDDIKDICQIINQLHGSIITVKSECVYSAGYYCFYKDSVEFTINSSGERYIWKINEEPNTTKPYKLIKEGSNTLLCDCNELKDILKAIK